MKKISKNFENCIEKPCTKCGETKPLDEFYKKNGKPRSACKKCCLSADKHYHATHKKEHYESVRAWKKANPERKNEQCSRWKKRRPDAVLVQKHIRRARKRNSAGAFSKAEWIELRNKHNNSCLCCGKSKPLTADHIIPLSRGGDNYISNIQPLCGSCNSKKGTKTIDFYSRTNPAA